ncbi:MAG: hypothetical protein QY318_01690 [Candidatus Dojkabacteria bacterium]|nr:MAG: hypothetical protein QY318_01690 [Candidatus Dojkabacteria bacterium]
MIKSREELDSFFVQSVEEGLEGLIAKSKKGGYQPGVTKFRVDKAEEVYGQGACRYN